MTIGEILKEYRLEQGKKQKEFAGDIVTPSYYSKVEKNIHRITAEDLIGILNHNNISLEEFGKRYNQSSQSGRNEIEAFTKMINDIISNSYYERNKTQLQRVKKLIAESKLSDSDKKEENLLVDAFLELMKDKTDLPDEKLRAKVKEKIFNIPNYNYTKVALFTNFLNFYDLESDRIIAKRIIKQFQNSKEEKIQIALLAIVVNILALSLRKGDLKDTDFFIKSADQIKIKPELFFYKSAVYFFKNMVRYRFTKDNKFYQNCQETQKFLSDVGMSQYGEILQRLLIKYK